MDATIAEEISSDILQVFKKLKALRAGSPKPHPSLDHAAYPILFCLEDGARRVSAIADTIHSDVSTVSRHVQALEAQGLVAKTPDPDDGRAHVVGLTEDGRALSGNVRTSYTEWFTDLLTGWSDKDVRALSAYLKQLDESLDSAHERKRQTATSKDTQ